MMGSPSSRVSWMIFVQRTAQHIPQDHTARITPVAIDGSGCFDKWQVCQGAILQCDEIPQVSECAGDPVHPFIEGFWSPAMGAGTV